MESEGFYFPSSVALFPPYIHTQYDQQKRPEEPTAAMLLLYSAEGLIAAHSGSNALH